MMEAYLQKAPLFYFSCTDEGNVIEVNQATASSMGYTMEELKGQKIDQLFTLPTRIFYQTHLFPLLRMQKKTEEIFITLQTKDKEEIPLLINAQRMDDDQKPINVFAGIVVYNRKKFEEELVAAKKIAEKALHENIDLIKAKQELQERTEKLDEQMFLVKKQNEEWLQFNRVVTHDLQEPLRKLHVFTNLLAEHNQHTAQNHIDKIKLVAQQMHSAISGLQQYVWLSEASLKTSQVDLANLLPDVESQLQAEFPEVNLDIQLKGDLIVEADRGQMTFLLYQLLSNSVRFRQHQSQVSVKISGITLSRNKFKNLSEKYKYEDYLKLQIADDGIGFNPTYSTQAFMLFKRLHENSGRGVGLSLCRRIIENHKGTVAIDSKPNEGTTVTIYLPLKQENHLEENETEDSTKTIEINHDAKTKDHIIRR